MLQFLILLTLAVLATAEFTADFKVKWGVGLSVGTDYIIDMPTSGTAAAALGYVIAERNSDSHLSTLILYCDATDVSICFLYDQNDFISGYQINVAVDKLTEIPYDLETAGFTKWTFNDTAYWSNELFLIDEDIAETVSEDVILRRDAVWARGFSSSEVIEIPTTPAEIEANTLFTKQGCVPSMGSHHYYNMSSEISCDAMYPWFTLFDDDQLIGMGYVIPGTYAAHTGDYVEKFERPSRTAVEVIVPSGPECLYEIADSPGLTTMHVYFISNPNSAGLNVGCLANTVSNLIGSI